MRRDVHDLPVAAAQPGSRRGVIEPAPQPEGGQAAAALGEKEVGGPVQPGMRQRPLRAAACAARPAAAPSSGLSCRRGLPRPRAPPNSDA